MVENMLPLDLRAYAAHEANKLTIFVALKRCTAF